MENSIEDKPSKTYEELKEDLIEYKPSKTHEETHEQTYEDFIKAVESSYLLDKDFNPMFNLISTKFSLTFDPTLSTLIRMYEKTINNKLVYLWLDTKGNICYNFDQFGKDYERTTALKLSKILSSYSGTIVEVRNNHKEIVNSKIGNILNTIKGQKDESKNEYTNSPITLKEEIAKERLSSPTYETIYIDTSSLILIYKHEFNPQKREAIYLKRYLYGIELYHKNSYIPTRFMSAETWDDIDVKNSFILSFIFAMVKNDLRKAMNVLLWIANCFNTLIKIPPLVLHSTDDVYMKLFYEEIIEPLFNKDFCEKIDNDSLDKNSLSVKLDKKVIYNFHNISKTTILDSKTKDLTKRLLYKDEFTINDKNVISLGNIIITSTSEYIPLIADDVPCLFIEIDSNLDSLKVNNNIESIDEYVVAKRIKDDMLNFADVLKKINIKLPNKEIPLDLYSKESYLNSYSSSKYRNILDGDRDILEVFNASIINKDLNLFKKIQVKEAKLYLTLIEDFKKNRVNRKNLIEYFSALFGENLYSSNRALISALKEKSNTAELFGNEKTINNNGMVYYKI